MANGAKDVASALEQAVSGAEATATSSDSEKTVDSGKQAAQQQAQSTPASQQDQGTKGKQTPGPVPYDRFHEKVEQFNVASEKIKELESKLSAAVEREDSLRSRLVEFEEDAQILDSIRRLADEDQEWRPTLERLEKRLKGIKDDVETGKTTEKQGEKDTAQALSDAKKELEEKFEEQQTDFIVMQARTLADNYLKNLPKEYADEERKVIQEMLTPRVDWNKVAENPVDLPNILADGLKKTLEAYGEPRGALSAKLREFEENKTETGPVETPEQIAKRLAETDWSEMTEVGQGESAKEVPKHSDEDFTTALAQQMKLLNR